MAKLPQFKDDDEFADFVDTHDMADYWDEFEDVDIVKVKRPKKKAITIPTPKSAGYYLGKQDYSLSAKFMPIISPQNWCRKT